MTRRSSFKDKMHRIVRNYFECIESVIGQRELCSAVHATANSLGFHSFAFLTLPDERQPLLVSTYPKEWTCRYIAGGYEGRDPVVLRACMAQRPFVWSRDMVEHFDRDAKDFFFEAEKFDICCGLTVPLPGIRVGKAAMTFAAHRGSKALGTCLSDCEPFLLFMAYHFRSHMCRMLEPVIVVEGAELTSRERQCLEWAMQGKSRSVTAQIMFITTRMVIRDLESAKAKLGVQTIGQAIAIYAAWKARGAAPEADARV